MKKSSIIIILALVMVLTLSLALTNTTATAKTPTTLPSVDVPLDAATGATDDPYFTVTNGSNFSGSGSYSVSGTTGKWSGTHTANQGNGEAIFKVVIKNTGTFSWTSNMTTYNGGLAVQANSSGTYYYRLVAGVSDTYLSFAEIQKGTVVTDARGDKAHSISITKTNLSNDQATLYFAFKSNTITSSLGSWAGQRKDSLAISGMSFAYLPPETVTINFSALESRGTVTAKCNNLTVANGEKVDKGATVTLTANPGSGNQFYYWTVDGVYAGDTATISIVADADKTIVAEVRQAGYYITRNGSKFYTSLKSFYTDNDKGTAIIIPGPAVTINEAVEIPSGATLIVPFSADGTSNKEGGEIRATWASNPSKYRYSQLNITSSGSLTVNGTLTVAATYGAEPTTASSSPQGLISGYYGQIVNNGTITIENGGVADIYGLITGDGDFVANGGTTTVSFVFNDFEGGSNTSSYNGTGVFPFSQYSFQNIWCHQVINHGATVKARALLYASSDYQYDCQNIIAPSGNGLLITETCSRIEIDYDETRYLATAIPKRNQYLQDFGLMTINIYGSVKAGNLIVSVGGVVDVDSADYTFTIPYNFNINIKNGGIFTVPAGYRFALLPGSILTVENGGTFNIQAGSSADTHGALYVVEGLDIVAKSSARYPKASELQNDGYNAGAKQPFSASGNLFVDGTLNINGTFAGIAQTNGNSGIIVTGSSAKLGITGYMLGSDYHEKNYIIAQAKSGVDNRVSMDITARVGRNSIANGNSVTTVDSFASLVAGKTYKALSSVNGNIIKTQLSSTVVNQYSNDLASNTNTTTAVTVNVNNAIYGTFYEWDEANQKYLVPTEIYIGESATGVKVNVDGIGSLFTNANGKLLQNESTTVTVPMDATGAIVYRTYMGEVAVGPGNETVYFDGTGLVTLDKVIKGAELDPSTNIICKFDKDGNVVETPTLKGRLTYYGTHEDDYTELTNVTMPDDEEAISSPFTYNLHGVTLSATVYQFTQAMATYQANVGTLTTVGADALVAKAVELKTEWDALVAGKTTNEVAFVNAQLSALNDYFGIYKTLAVQDKAYYGDTTTTATATTVGGETVNNVTVNVGSFVYDNTNGLTATLSYTGNYTHNATNYPYNLSVAGATATPKAITVVIPDG
ncbi:MAG: hypothetical protein IJX23_00060, partial [Clostridia bacterium]|nr:hypothetical protein [Clostridia bacterium]